MSGDMLIGDTLEGEVDVATCGCCGLAPLPFPACHRHFSPLSLSKQTRLSSIPVFSWMMDLMACNAPTISVKVGLLEGVMLQHLFTSNAHSGSQSIGGSGVRDFPGVDLNGGGLSPPDAVLCGDGFASSSLSNDPESSSSVKSGTGGSGSPGMAGMIPTRTSSMSLSGIRLVNTSQLHLCVSTGMCCGVVYGVRCVVLCVLWYGV